MDECCPQTVTRVEAGENWSAWLARREALPSAPWEAGEIAELAAFNRRCGAGVELLERIELLGRRETLCVVAGQQAGLFLTPMLILHKALAAVGWARRLEAMLGRPVLALFWIASEDHDFEEVRHFRWIDKEGRLRVWSYAPRCGGAGRSLFDVPMEREPFEGLLEELRRDLPAGDYREELLESMADQIAGSADLEELFGRALMEYGGGLGLVLLPSRLGALRRRAGAVLARELEQPGVTARLVRAAGEARGSGDGEAALHRRGDEVNCFVYRGGLRAALRLEGDWVRVLDPRDGSELERVAPGALLEELREHPERFSPNVVTRPAVQNAALPTIAQVAGPGERGYLELLDESHALLGVFKSRVLARPRLLLLTPRTERLMERLGIDREGLAAEDWSLLEREAFERAVNERGGRALGKLEDDIASAFARTGENLGELLQSPAAASAWRRTREGTEFRLGRLRERLREDWLRRERLDAGRYGALEALLRPGGLPQERALAPASPFRLNYGTALAEGLLEWMDLDAEGRLQLLALSQLHR